MTTEAEDLETRLDPVVDDEIKRGFRIIEVPDGVKSALDDADIQPPTHIRLTRLNPARRRKITEVVQRAYFKDLKDAELLSNSQVQTLAEGRGEWSPLLDARIKELKERTTIHLASLYNEGVAKSDEWLKDLAQHIDRFLDIVAASKQPAELRDEVTNRFSRWHQYRPDKQELYADRYADELKGGSYYPDRDLGWLLDNAPTLEAADVLEDITELNDKLGKYLQLVQEREELEELTIKRLRMFANTVESRRDNAEEMARSYFTTERCTEDGTPTGPIMLTFDTMYDLPDDAVRWLIDEQFYFHNNIPDEIRYYAETLAFRTAEPGTAEAPAPLITASPTSPEQSDESPEASTPSTAGPQSEETPSATSD